MERPQFPQRNARWATNIVRAKQIGEAIAENFVHLIEATSNALAIGLDFHAASARLGQPH
jgi:hypothetical protein